MPGSIDERITTGIDGLDDVLHGGLIPGRSYLVRGDPGTGKTILGLHYLTAAPEETPLLVNLEESEADVRANASTLGIDLSGVEFLDLGPKSEAFVDDRSYDLFSPSEVEQEPFVDEIRRTVERVEPDRVFVDPITQLRYLTPDDYQFRQQVMGFTQFLTDAGATVLFTSQATAATPDEDLQFMTDGTVHLGEGSVGTVVDVPKFRGSGVRDGEHAMAVTDDGIEVYPQLRPDEHDEAFVAEAISSDVDELDDLLGGGIERGTVTVISGPTGAGKTTMGTRFMQAAAERDERSAVYLFEEAESTFRERSEAIGIPVTEMADSGSLAVREMEPLDLSPQAFAQQIRDRIDAGVGVVMIDGVTGYKRAVQGDDETLVRRLHALCRHLKNVGVTVILVDEHDAVTGEFEATEAGISYIADNIVFLQHVEHEGRLRKTVGVLKKRTSDFERTLRELEITGHGIEVGEPLTGLRGVLTGTPEWVGDGADR